MELLMEVEMQMDVDEDVDVDEDEDEHWEMAIEAFRGGTFVATAFNLRFLCDFCCSSGHNNDDRFRGALHFLISKNSFMFTHSKNGKRELLLLYIKEYSISYIY